jgi:AraC-like DNA-binding protein
MLIGQIAKACGYQNGGHFARQFKALTGVSPGSWRKGAHGKGMGKEGSLRPKPGQGADPKLAGDQGSGPD